jgi:predicted MFS family arabinose efflux permease
MSTGTAAAGAPAVAHRTPTYAWVVLFMLMFIYIFNFLDRQLMSILIEPIKDEMGFSNSQMGLMTGFYFALFYTGFGVIVGFLADRTSRKFILGAGAILWSAFTALCGMAQNYPTMLAARVGVGVGEAAGAPPSYSILSDYFPPEKRGLALALFSLGVPFGQALGAGFGAALHETVGWRNAFIGIGAAGVVAAVVMLLVVREPKRGAMDANSNVSQAQAEHNASQKVGFTKTFWDFMSRPALLWTALGCGLCSFVGYAALGWNVSFLVRVKGINYTEVALFYALMLAVAMGLGTWISGAVVDWLAKRSKVWYALLPASAMALAIPFWLAYVWAPTWQMSIAILAVPTFLTIMYLPPALALVQNSVSPSQRTMSGALLLMVLNIIGLGGGPTMVGMLNDFFGATQIVDALGTTRDQALEYLKMPAAQLATLPEATRQTIAAASGGGLQMAMYWVTPFYFVAVAFILLQSRAVTREIKAGGAVNDGGFRLGLVLLAVGLVGLYLRFQGLGFPGAVLNIDRLGQFGTFDLVGQIDAVMDAFTSIVLTIFTLWGLWLVATGLTRKSATAQA